MYHRLKKEIVHSFCHSNELKQVTCFVEVTLNVKYGHYRKNTRSIAVIHVNKINKTSI